MFAVGFFATLCLVLPYVTSESPDKGTEILGYVASLLTVAFRFTIIFTCGKANPINVVINLLYSS